MTATSPHSTDRKTRAIREVVEAARVIHDRLAKQAKYYDHAVLTFDQIKPLTAALAALPTKRGPGCYDCGLPYTDPGFADLVVSHDVWAKISPTGHEGGLLCPTCMVRAAEKAGVTAEAVFRSGPFIAALDSLEKDPVR